MKILRLRLTLVVAEVSQRMETQMLLSWGIWRNKQRLFCGVTQEMKDLTDDITTQNLMILPDKVWVCVKGEMDAIYPGAWSSFQKKQGMERVRKYSANLGLEYVISTITDTLEHRLLLEHILAQKIRRSTCEWWFSQLLSFLFLLEVPLLDMYVDATFDCTLCPFHQCLIVMVHNPVLYALISHSNEKLYWQVFSAIIYCSGWQIKANLTRLILCAQWSIRWLSSSKELGGGVHVGCLFYPKQAWWKYLIKKCKFSCDNLWQDNGGTGSWCIVYALYYQVQRFEKYGIPFLCLTLEKEAHDELIKNGMCSASHYQKLEYCWQKWHSTWDEELHK